MNHESLLIEKSKIHFRQAKWQSEKILDGLELEKIIISEKTKATIHPAIWRNITSEYDAVHFSRLIHQHQAKLSPEFMEFERLWYVDEINHYNGLRKIYSNIYHLDENEVHTQVSSRIPDFNNFLSLLDDEFFFA